MRVAVIIPSRNMAGTLARAIESCAGADEIHVVDDASVDHTQEVVARLDRHVYLWRWPVKSRCHLSALRVVYEACQCDQIVGLGADDALLPGFVPAVRDYGGVAVVFTDYAVIDEGGRTLYTIEQGFDCPTVLVPEEMQRRVAGERHATETGIGSSLRKDVADWLWRHGWESLGPHMDSVGYATAACRFGCVFVPIVGAAYTMASRSFGRDNEPDRDRWGRSFLNFVGASGLEESAARALGRKRVGITWA